MNDAYDPADFRSSDSIASPLDRRTYCTDVVDRAIAGLLSRESTDDPDEEEDEEEDPLNDLADLLGLEQF